MEIRHLRYVIAVAEELHFGRAAKSLNMSQPPLSRHIKMIEEELGMKLFDRSKRSVCLTDDGVRFVEEARTLLSLFTYATKPASRRLEGEITRLVIGTDMVHDRHLAECVKVFSEQFPEVRLELQTLETDEQAKALRERRMHVGFVVLPIEESALAVERMWSEPRLVGLPKNHALAHRHRIPLAALAPEPFILLSRSVCSRSYDQILRACANANFTIKVAYEVTNMAAGLALVEAGLGLSIFPAAMQYYARGAVVFRDVYPPFPVVDHALAYRLPDDSTVLRSFVSVAKKILTRPRSGQRNAEHATNAQISSKVLA